MATCMVAMADTDAIPHACETSGEGVVMILAQDAASGDFVSTQGVRIRQTDLHPAEDMGTPVFHAPRALRVFLTDRRADRWGRRSGHLADARSGAWVARALVARGHAVVAPDAAGADCLRPLFDEEARARAGGHGLWAREPVWNAARPSRLEGRTGRHTVIAGQVLSVGETSRNVYLNFGRRWSHDFTVTIAATRLDDFAAAGLDVRSLEGAAIRVRGVVQQDRGPHIELRHPAQIERLDKDGQGR